MDIIPLLWSMRKSIIKNQLIIIVITIIFVFIIPKTYTSTALLMPPTSETGGMGSIMGALSNLPFGGMMSQTNDESLSTIAILKSRTLSEKVIKKFNLIGIPYQLIIGKRTEGDFFEFKEVGGETQKLKIEEIASQINKAAI